MGPRERSERKLSAIGFVQVCAPRTPTLLAVLREEIVAVIARHVLFEPDKIQIKMDRGKSVSTLEIDIEIPSRLIGNVSAP
jgi:septum formation topological specificity factor MinE